MCDRCADIDYPINDPIWLPCGGHSSRYTSAQKVRRPFKREEDTNAWETLGKLLRGMTPPPPQKPTDGFEGVE